MKNIKYVLAIAGLMLGLFSAPVLATNTTDTTTTAAQLQQLIQSLQQQIATLQSQMQTLQQAQSAVKETSKEVSSTLKLIGQLRLGMTGDDVKLLQEMLATDPDIYPEGLITGIYGKLTERAVKRFQERNCLSQVGNVGPQTLSKINEILQEGAGKSGKVPSGLLKAPGIWKKFCATSSFATTTHATTTRDVVPPVISEVSVTEISSTSATITWVTDEKANGVIWYGITSPFATSTAVTVAKSTLVVKDNDFSLNHSLKIRKLAPNTVYYYVVASVDGFGNRTFDTEKSFTTLSQ